MVDNELPDKARNYLHRNFYEALAPELYAALLQQAEVDWSFLVKSAPLIAVRGIVVTPQWLEETRPSPNLDLGSWWTTHSSMAGGYSSNGDIVRYDDSRWSRLQGDTRCKVLLQAEFPMVSLNLPRMLGMHYLRRGLRPFSFDGSEVYFAEGSIGRLLMLTADGEPLPSHPLVGADFTIKIEPGSDRILAEFVSCEGWDTPSAPTTRSDPLGRL